MKIYISADIEGVTGVTHWNETELTHGEAQAAREQMTAEVAAACEGALDAGAAEVWVKDSHDSARNIFANRLPKATRLIRGWSGHPFLTLQELDASFAGVGVVGYHSRAGSGGNPLAHTFSGKVTGIRLNDVEMSEFSVDLFTAAYVGAPLIFVAGDRGLCDEAAGYDSQIRTVAVKQGVGNSTVSIHPELAVERIRAKMAEAVGALANWRRYSLPDHFVLEARYRRAEPAYHDAFYPGVLQVDDVTLRFESNDYFDVLRFMLFTIQA